MTTYLYIGLRENLDKWMHREEINPSEHGKSVKWANNGPNHLRLSDAPIMVIEEDDWYEKTVWDEMAIKTAGHLNAIFAAQAKRAKGVRT